MLTFCSIFCVLSCFSEKNKSILGILKTLPCPPCPYVTYPPSVVVPCQMQGVFRLFGGSVLKLTWTIFIILYVVSLWLFFFFWRLIHVDWFNCSVVFHLQNCCVIPCSFKYIWNIFHECGSLVLLCWNYSDVLQIHYENLSSYDNVFSPTNML